MGGFSHVLGGRSLPSLAMVTFHLAFTFLAFDRKGAQGFREAFERNGGPTDRVRGDLFEEDAFFETESGTRFFNHLSKVDCSLPSLSTLLGKCSSSFFLDIFFFFLMGSVCESMTTSVEE